MFRFGASAFLLMFSLAQAQAPSPPRQSLRERAAGGDADAQFTLAKNYEAGRGGLKQDYAEAERWYRLAANQGEPFAQASLGILYRFGKGVPQDFIQAYTWFHLAISRTSGSDRESIAELRDSTAAKLTPQQVAEAIRRANEWRNSKP